MIGYPRQPTMGRLYGRMQSLAILQNTSAVRSAS
jgi:hypothetical protein